MSPQLISRNLDLLRLQEDGFDVAIVANHLVVRNVPFVTRRCTIAHGMLVSTLSLSGDRTQRPDTHVAMFAGEIPCDSQGRSEEHTSELQSLMRISYAVFCLKKKIQKNIVDPQYSQ